MKSGVIKLLDSNDRLIFQEAYKSVEQRGKIISAWEDLYNDRFRFCFIHIAPDIEPEIPSEPYIKKRRRYKPIGGGIGSHKIQKPTTRTHYH